MGEIDFKEWMAFQRQARACAAVGRPAAAAAWSRKAVRRHCGELGGAVCAGCGGVRGKHAAWCAQIAGLQPPAAGRRP